MSLLNMEGDCVTEKSDDTSISTQLSAIFNRLDAMQESYNGRLDALVDSSEARFSAMERVLAEIGSDSISEQASNKDFATPSNISQVSKLQNSEVQGTTAVLNSQSPRTSDVQEALCPSDGHGNDNMSEKSGSRVPTDTRSVDQQSQFASLFKKGSSSKHKADDNKKDSLLDLETDILDQHMEETIEKPSYGPNVSEKLAETIGEFFLVQSGKESVLKKIREKHQMPENCVKVFKPQALNPIFENSKRLPKLHKSIDQKFVDIQEAMGESAAVFINIANMCTEANREDRVVDTKAITKAVLNGLTFLGAANRKIIQQRKLKLNAAIQGDLSTLVEKDLTSSSFLFGDELTPTWVKDQKQSNMIDDYLFEKAKEPARKKQKREPKKSFLSRYKEYSNEYLNSEGRSQNQSDRPSNQNTRKDKYPAKYHKSKSKDQKNKRPTH